jgi:23S rRNA G2069 N7-methylase RlmK/C1962 C5-methylase RlmI
VSLLTPARVAAQAEMLGNRVAKRFHHLHPRMEREGVGAFRLYDRDIPEVRAVVDWYEGHVLLTEYARTQTDAVPDWLGAMARGVAKSLGLPESRAHGGGRGAPRAEGGGERVTVREGAMRFLVDLDDPLDGALRLEHRLTRARVLREAAGRRALILFGHTGAFTVAAAKGGATSTVTVDLSGRSLDRARENLTLNAAAPGAHVTRREDAVWFLRDEASAGRRYDLAVLDAPTVSARGGVQGIEVQRDHRALIDATLAVLAPGGVLFFATSHPRFAPQLEGLAAKELTAETLPEDYRGRTPHRLWRITA